MRPDRLSCQPLAPLCPERSGGGRGASHEADLGTHLEIAANDL